MKTDQSGLRPRRYCGKCDRTRELKFFSAKSGVLCKECHVVDSVVTVKVGCEFEGSVSMAAAERHIRETRDICGLR